jgi:regulator of sirC expression with transglutaminase-like and TPR domain
MTIEEARAALLAAAAEPSPDIAGAALWIAAEDCEAVDRDGCLARLEELADELRSRSGAGGGVGTAAVMAAMFRDRLGLRGAGGGDPRAHYIHEVLRRGAAVPIACSAVWMAVGRRAGIDIEGVGLPGRFIVRVEGTLIDAAAGGDPLDDEDLRTIVAKALGREPDGMDPAWLAEPSVRSILARMSRNLRGCYASMENWPLALRAADRCVDLLPQQAEERRDRGLLLWRMGRNQEALADLRDYLEKRPGAKDEKSVQEVVGRLLAFMN